MILNSRNRPHLLSNFLESVVATTDNIDEIEIIIGLDNDDPTLSDSLAVVGRYPSATPVVGGRPSNLIHALNALACRSVGSYLFILNDDVILRTQGWDTLAYLTLSAHVYRHPSGVVYGRTHDLSIDKDKDGKYAAFPIISKKACEILGFCMPNEFCGLGGDVATYRIYDAVDRVADLEITLDHVLHRTVEQVVNPDKTAYEMRQLTYQNRMDWKDYDISTYVEKLQNYIQNYVDNF